MPNSSRTSPASRSRPISSKSRSERRSLSSPSSRRPAARSVSPQPRSTRARLRPRALRLEMAARRLEVRERRVPALLRGGDLGALPEDAGLAEVVAAATCRRQRLVPALVGRGVVAERPAFALRQAWSVGPHTARRRTRCRGRAGAPRPPRRSVACADGRRRGPRQLTTAQAVAPVSPARSIAGLAIGTASSRSPVHRVHHGLGDLRVELGDEVAAGRDLASPRGGPPRPSRTRRAPA